MGLSLDELDPPLDDLAFLSRSNNRIAVLDELARDDRTRRELRDATGVSRPTLGRVLDGFEERGWVASTGPGNGHEYSLTPLGRVVVEAFGDAMAAVGTVQKLRELAPRIPFDELGLDPRALADADVTTPTPTDATAHTRRERELLARTNRILFLCNQAQPETVERYRDWAVEGDRELEAIVSGDAVDAAMADEAMATALGDMVAADGVTIHRYGGSVSAMLGLFEDVASIVPLDDTGVPIAFVESDDETVRAAVRDALERYRDRSDPVSIGSHTR
jgi:DNA-binding MarR family transcriptional regulator